MPCPLNVFSRGLYHGNVRTKDRYILRPNGASADRAAFGPVVPMVGRCSASSNGLMSRVAPSGTPVFLKNLFYERLRDKIQHQDIIFLIVFRVYQAQDSA